MELTVIEREVAFVLIESLMEYGLLECLDTDNDLSAESWFYRNKIHNFGFFGTSGATKFCFSHPDLPGWIIKIGYDGLARDYMEREYENYLAAKNCGLEHFFPVTAYVGEIQGYSCYAQQEVECCEEDVRSGWYEELRERFVMSGDEFEESDVWDEVDWLEDEERVNLLFHNEELIRFLRERNINDLHEGNFGYIGCCAVIIDFSGWDG